MENFIPPKIQQPQTGLALLKESFKTYFYTLHKNLPLSALITLIVIFIAYSPTYVPARYIETTNMVAMFVLITIIPLLSMIVMVIHNYLEAKPTSYGKFFIYSIQRFLSIIGCIVSSSLLPLIVILFCIIIYFLLLSVQTPLIILFLAPSLMYLLVALSVLPKIFSVILTLTEEMDTNTALETSSAMVKGFFGRSFLYFVFALTLIVLILNIPAMILYYFPNEVNIPAWASIILLAVSIFIAIPWIIALWVVHQKDLYLRYQIQNLSKKKPLKKDKQTYHQKSKPHKDGMDF